MTGTLQGFVNHMLADAANPRIRYGSYDCSNRCNPHRSGCCDCSGSVCDALASQGVNIGCTGSFDLARRCYAAGTIVPLAVGFATYGAMLFKGINQGRGGIPGVDEGHVGVSLGNGYEVNALSHRYGYIVNPISWVTWSGAYRNPWFAAPAPPKPPAPKGLKLIASVLNVGGTLEEFKIVSGGAVQHRWQTAPGGSFTGWVSLGGSGILSIDATLGHDGHIVLSGIIGNGNWLHNRQQPNGVWTGWH